VLVLSHFRGKLSDCDTIADICTEHGIILIEFVSPL
jgi:dTDP-4-amino-4,6-dideoxygalactose transaminase